MTTKISQWQRIAMLAAGISTSMVSMAWGQNLYQTQSDGSIWQYTGTRGMAPTQLSWFGSLGPLRAISPCSAGRSTVGRYSMQTSALSQLGQLPCTTSGTEAQ
jgi:hypothetical protein